MKGAAWEMQTLSMYWMTAKATGNTRHVHGLAYSPNGKLLASRNWGQTLDEPCLLPLRRKVNEIVIVS